MTQVVNAVIALLAVVVTAFVIPWLKKKISADKMDEFLKWVEIAVAAAQQLYYDLDGDSRKQYVLDFLAEKGYDINMPEINSAIEAAVLKLHQTLIKGE